MSDSLEALKAASVDHTLSNRAIFNALLYTPWRDAVAQLEQRQSNAALTAYVHAALPTGIPELMQKKNSMVLFRHVATSNYEIRRFMMAADALQDLSPLILEYLGDKFNDRNEGKYFLGKLCFHKGMNSKGEAMWESVRVIDFNGSNNKPISSLYTTWGQSFVEFHHELFKKNFPNHPESIFDLSDWLRAFGTSAKEYYKPFLSLFLQNGILFENFLLEKNEFGFTQQIILPAFLEIMEETGIKPLVVALEPTEIEGDQFWYSHPLKDKQLIEQGLASKPGILTSI